MRYDQKTKLIRKGDSLDRILKLFFVVLLGLVFIACATTSGTAPSGQQSGTTMVQGEGGAQNFLGQYYSLLKPGPEGGAKLRWIKPGVDLRKYNKVMLDSVVFYLAKDSDYKGIDPEVMKDLADKFNKNMVDALKDKYQLVSEPGPDVVRLRFAITNLEQSNPVLSGVSSVIPIGLGISVIKKGATGAWAGSGATGLAVMALDSTTNDVIVAGVDERAAGFSERFSKWGSAEEAFKFWAERLRKFMDETRGMKQ